MPNLRSKTWTTTTPATVGDAQFWEDHLISDEAAQKAAGAVQSVNNTLPDENGNINITPSPLGPTVVDSLNSTSATDALSANQGHVLKDLVDTKQNTLAFDNTPTKNSTNPVKSGGVYDAISPKVSETLLKDTVGWVGKNGLPLTLTEMKTRNTSGTWSGNAYTYRDITITISTDNNGYVTEIDVNGTASGEVDFKLYRGTTSQGAFIFSKGTSTNRPILYIYSYAKSATIVSISNDAEKSVTIDSQDAADVGINLNIPSGTSALSHVKVYPMLRDASIADSTFEPYHKSVEDWGYTREEANVMGAKNLFNHKLVNETKNDVVVTVNSDKSVSLSGTCSVSGFFNFDAGLFKDIFADFIGVPCILSLQASSNDTAVGLQIHGYDGDNNHNIMVSVGEEKSFTVTQAALSLNNAGFYLQVKNGNQGHQFSVTLYPMIRLAADTDSTYQPYAMTNRELTEDRYYKAGDVISLTYKIAHGFITSSSTELQVAVDLPKMFPKSFPYSVLTVGTFTVRGVGGYLVAAGTAFTNYKKSQNFMAADNNTLRIIIKKSDDTAFDGATNNTPIVVTFDTASYITLA